MSTITDTRSIWFVDSCGRVIVSADDSKGRMSVVEVSGARGQMPPLHVHRTDDEVFHVIEGELTVYVGPKVVHLAAGDTAFAPRDIPTPIGSKATGAAGSRSARQAGSTATSRR